MKTKETDQERYIRMHQLEINLYEQDIFHIIGIDEVGRGPLAGDVVVAGVILDPNKPIYGLNDSKKISKKKIPLLAEEIKKNCLAYKISPIKVKDIDQLGINGAITKGVNEVIKYFLEKKIMDYILIDYMKIDLKYPHLILKKGDATSNSIAAASIIAKNYRDEELKELSKKYPYYGWENNAGYGTKQHRESIEKYGIVEGIHRKSFEPIKSKIKEK